MTTRAANDGDPNDDPNDGAAASRQSIIDACLAMDAKGLNQGTSGNVSARHGDGLLITPSGVPYGQMSPADIVPMSLDGTVPGGRKPSSEWRFHRDILAARPEVGAVVHAHPPYATGLAINRMPIPAVHYMVAISGGNSIRVADYATFGTPELSRHVLAALEGRTCCLMANHGMIATGPTLAKALWLAEEVETLAKQYTIALRAGTPTYLDDDEIARVLEKFKGYGPRL
jgi:L-fuculose-phosphate aldolase